MRSPTSLLLIGLLLASSVQADNLASKPSPDSLEFFEKKIRPLLAQNCFKCHSHASEKLKGKLFLDSREGLLTGGENGPAIIPGNPDKSRLIQAVRGTDPDTVMPPKGDRLSASAIADLSTWIKNGAAWPEEAAPKTTASPDYASNYEHLRKELWSWQPITNPPAPAVKATAWPKDDIDKFILARLEEKSLAPSPQADKLSLLRRATFDLTGLPPTPDEIDAFLRDTSPAAFEKVVDRLLDSPRFGERWGRHWLDVARYAESSGMSRNQVYYYAWRYRDYVIDSFNTDKPFNRFIREQIAGDLLPAKSPAEKDQLTIATGFLAIGPRDYNERNPRQFQMNAVDEQIDTMGRAILATTISCARCHDHKFDPIPTAEYYAIAGILTSSEEFTGLEKRRAAKINQHNEEQLVKLSGWKPSEAPEKEQETDELKATVRESFRKLFIGSKFGGNFTKPATPIKHLAMGMQDSSRPADTRILLRGELDKPGDTVSRGFLTIPCMSSPPAISPGESGRLELSLWLTRPDNPLTARVMVNRIWQHLFGEGLVHSVDNFGVTGDKPTHPQLLDHLASQFIHNGWSVKKSIRQIMLTSAYQQSASFDRAKYNVDPDNTLLWRMNQRRLEGEAIRDAILAASGKLTLTPPTASVALDMPPIEIRPTARLNPADLVSGSTFRSVYLPVFRNAVPEALEVFDFADPAAVTGRRDVTTVAPQALYMLNSTFIIAQSQAMAIRVTTQAPKSDAARVDLAYKLTLARAPSPAERDRALAYINAFMRDPTAAKTRDADHNKLEACASFCQALFSSAEFRYLN